jgi:hypothetical protein
MEVGFSSSTQGIQNAFDQNAARAKRLSKGVEDDQLEKDMAELPQDKADVGVNTAVIKTKDQMLGTLLDMVA